MLELDTGNQDITNGGYELLSRLENDRTGTKFGVADLAISVCVIIGKIILIPTIIQVDRCSNGCFHTIFNVMCLIAHCLNVFYTWNQIKSHSSQIMRITLTSVIKSSSSILYYSTSILTGEFNLLTFSFITMICLQLMLRFLFLTNITTVDLASIRQLMTVNFKLTAILLLLLVMAVPFGKAINFYTGFYYNKIECQFGSYRSGSRQILALGKCSRFNHAPTQYDLFQISSASCMDLIYSCYSIHELQPPVWNCTNY